MNPQVFDFSEESKGCERSEERGSYTKSERELLKHLDRPNAEFHELKNAQC
jgi:hypothetical protein